MTNTPRTQLVRRQKLNPRRRYTVQRRGRRGEVQARAAAKSQLAPRRSQRCCRGCSRNFCRTFAVKSRFSRVRASSPPAPLTPSHSSKAPTSARTLGGTLPPPRLQFFEQAKWLLPPLHLPSLLLLPLPLGELPVACFHLPLLSAVLSCVSRVLTRRDVRPTGQDLQSRAAAAACP